jgi:cytochrome c
MFMHRAVVVLSLVSGAAIAAGPNLGQPLSHAELAAWDINVLPDGTDLRAEVCSLPRRAG